MADGESKYRNFFALMREPAAFIDQRYKIIEANPSYLSLYSVKKSQITGRPCYEVAYGKEKPCTPCFVKEAIKTGALSSGAHSHQDGGGRLRHFEIAAIPLTDKKAAVEIIKDITDSVEEKQRLEDKDIRLMGTISKGKKEWEATFDSIISPIFIHDREFRIIRVNRAYMEISGLPFNEIIGKPYYEVFPMRDGPLHLCSEAIETGDIGKKVEEIISPSGEIFVSEASPIIEDGKPVSFVHVLKDITKLTNAQRKLKEEAQTLSSLLELTTDIGRLLDIGAILEEVSRTAMRLLSADRTVIFLRDEEGEYRVSVFHGWQEHLVPSINTLRLRRGEMPAIDMLLKGEDISIENAKASGLILEKLTEDFGLRAVLLCPLITGEGVTGAIMAERQAQFSERDRSVLKGIASNTAIAVENARLYKESIEMASDLARRMESIKTTYEIDRTILSTLNRKEILEVATKNIQRIIPADRVSTAYLNEEGTGYTYKTELIPFGISPFLDSIVRSGRVTSVPNISGHRHGDPVVMDFAREGYGSLIAFPLYTKGRRFGCIVMASRRVGAFDKDDISNGEKLTAQVGIALENAKLYEDIKELFLSIIMALVNTVDAKSPWTKGHSERVTEYALLIAKEMGLREEELERLRLASLLHDIGKIGTYDIVLDKPERLTDEEFELVKKHPLKGAEILEPIKQLKDIVPIVRAHHEKMDGGGYPYGLKGDEIPLLAKILCIADSFDSMTADRPYRAAPGKAYAVSELKRCSGSQFDPEVVKAFLRVIK